MVNLTRVLYKRNDSNHWQNFGLFPATKAHRVAKNLEDASESRGTPIETQLQPYGQQQAPVAISNQAVQKPLF